ncbi:MULTISPECIES: cyclophane-forming radical SAM peptide maturase AmcB [Micromonospora]|uniref:cyclophane-forming radical SAM peptide maturase AmcB n=1 Tax=Micromonospora TaxID=1873 RepID=UPI0001BF2296|nr:MULTISPECIES: cyclophane-forming radical SAM peptide maturase AmcB [Micromonospora]ADL44780.1 Radical SAM domain protein [Micromonospora aurantiaca ATCC 27029]OHX03894.1 radical SAM protein [Micromonospora sp. WMMB235]
MNGIGLIDSTGQPAVAGSFHTLVVQPTSFCNLDCTYCYLPDRRSLRLMSGAVAQACAESIAQQNSGHPVSVVWHGGEPTATPIGLFRDLLAPFEELRRAGLVCHEIQTNATLINRQWCELFTTYGFEVGVSIDGPGALNRNRLDRAGNPTDARTLRGMHMLAGTGLRYSVICVVTPETIEHADALVDFFTGLPGCESVGFNIEEQEGADRAPVAEDDAYRFWQQLIARRVGGSTLRIRDVDRLADYIAATRSGHVDHAPYEPIPTVSWDGQVVLLSPELLGITEPRYGDFIAGNVLQQPITAMLAGAGDLDYVAEFLTALNDCADHCAFYDFCRGAQAGNRYFEHATFTARETTYCRTTRQALVRAAADHLTPQGEAP